MNVGVIRFPGTNNERDMMTALASFEAITPTLIPHFSDEELSRYDALVLPGGFSYGDYLRPGAVATTTRMMKKIRDVASTGIRILGICNGFQILTESELLPGVLLPNKHTRFICKWVHVKGRASKEQVLSLPIAHFEGNYFVDEEGLRELEKNQQIALQYSTKEGEVTEKANPNGSLRNIAAVWDKTRTILGMMPHPERASFAYLGSTDGRQILEQFLVS